MSTWDSADLLTRFNELTARPSADAITDAQKYVRLSRAQSRVVAMLAAVSPQALYPRVAADELPTLTTTDYQRFTFGRTRTGAPIFPMGKGGVYASLKDIPDRPWVAGVDYIDEGTQIRIPNDGTYTGTLYWYGVTNPPDITAIVQPALVPEAARELIVIEAARQFAMEGVRDGALVDQMADEWARAWPTWTTVYRTQFRRGGALTVLTGRDLALAAQG